MVRHLAPLGRRLGGADIHAAIKGHRVERNDLGIDPLRQLDPHRRLAAAVGPVRYQAFAKVRIGNRQTVDDLSRSGDLHDMTTKMSTISPRDNNQMAFPWNPHCLAHTIAD